VFVHSVRVKNVDTANQEAIIAELQAENLSFHPQMKIERVA